MTSPAKICVAVLFALACSNSPVETLESEQTQSQVCPKQSTATRDGVKVIECLETFKEAPFVHAPADESADGTGTSFTGSIVPSLSFGSPMMAIKADGSRFAVVDGGKLASFVEPPDALHGLGFPTNRVLFTLYRVTGKVGEEIDTPWGPLRGLTVTQVKPSIVIGGCALTSVLLGTWEGVVSTRLAPPAAGRIFDEQATTPIRMTLDSLSSIGTLTDWAAGSPIEKADNFRLQGTIDNFDSSVEGFPPLRDLGTKEPFKGASSGKIALYRLGNMHGQSADGHWVLDYPKGSEALTVNGMTIEGAGLFAVGAASLIQKRPSSDLEEIVIRAHLPFQANGHVVRLHPANIGNSAGRCASD